MGPPQTAGRWPADRGELVDEVAAAVLGVDEVVALHGGAFSGFGTYLPGRRVPGIRLREEDTEIHLTVTLGAPVGSTAQRVRQAIAGLVPGAVDVTVEDVVAAEQDNQNPDGGR